MKRYSMNTIGEPRPNALGLWAEYSEVQALLRAVADEVKGMEHETECEALEFDAGDSECNCQRGKVLAMLEVE